MSGKPTNTLAEPGTVTVKANPARVRCSERLVFEGFTLEPGAEKVISQEVWKKVKALKDAASAPYLVEA